jgi:hypothetical protein
MLMAKHYSIIKGRDQYPVNKIAEECYTVIFPSPAGMSLTKLSLGGNNLYMTSLFPPRESLVSDILAGVGTETSKSFFYGV